MNIFDISKSLDPQKAVCHSGGAIGSDTVFEEKCSEIGIKVNAYSYKTNYHNSPNKVEISDNDHKEGISEINKANKLLCRYGINKYMNLLARNWAQVKYSDQIFAIGYIINPKEKSKSGYYSKAKIQTIDGGTGYACMMGILNNKELYVFNLKDNNWYRWSYTTDKFIKCIEEPKITKFNFAGIGTREITNAGIEAIEKLINTSFK